MAARFWRWMIGVAVAISAREGLAAAIAVTLFAVAGAGGRWRWPTYYRSSGYTRSASRSRSRAPAKSRHIVFDLLAPRPRGEHGSCALQPRNHRHEPRSPRKTGSGEQARSRSRAAGVVDSRLLCNRAIWRPLEVRLQAAGFAPVHAVNLEPLCADIDSQARSLGPELLGLHQKSNGARVAIVTHSMGGLVVRSLLRTAGSDMISRIVTIAGPHHGTRLRAVCAVRQRGRCCRDSPWLRALGARRRRSFLRSLREHL